MKIKMRYTKIMKSNFQTFTSFLHMFIYVHIESAIIRLQVVAEWLRAARLSFEWSRNPRTIDGYKIVILSTCSNSGWR